MNPVDHDTLLLRQARVVAVDAGQVMVRLERMTACSSCPSAKLCGAGAQGHELSLPLMEPSPLTPGDTVNLGMTSTAVLHATAVAYLTPLAGLVIAMALASACGFADGGVAVFSLLGLGLGFLTMRYLAQRTNPHSAPVLVMTDHPCHSPNPPSEDKS